MSLEEARRYVLERARARGVAVEILAERSREFSARARDHRVDQLTQASRGGLGVRVVVDGRAGYGYTEDLSPQALDWMLEEAIGNAQLQTDSEEFLPAGSALGTHDLVGDSLSASPEAKVQTALGFEATLREDRRVKHVLSAGYSEREWEVAVTSTEGADGTFRRGVAGMVASYVMQDGESRKQGFESDWTTELAMHDPGRTALMFTERTGRLLGARPLRTGRYRAYFEPKAFASLLASFWWMWSGKAVVEGKSRLGGRLGESIASPIVTMVDDPTLRNGLGSRPFDAEGAPAEPAVLVDRGVLKSFLTNSETARRLNLPNTAHAARGYRTAVVVAPSNFYLKPGGGLALSEGVMVTEIMGEHAGTNPISGEFSVQALGLWVENGAVAHPLENLAVAGDFLTLLERIVALGPELEWELGGRIAFGAPLVEVAELSFAGA